MSRISRLWLATLAMSLSALVLAPSASAQVLPTIEGSTYATLSYEDCPSGNFCTWEHWDNNFGIPQGAKHVYGADYCCNWVYPGGGFSAVKNRFGDRNVLVRWNAISDVYCIPPGHPGFKYVYWNGKWQGFRITEPGGGCGGNPVW